MRKMVEVLGKAKPTYSDIGATLAGTHLTGFTTTTTKQCWAPDPRRFSVPWTVSRHGKRTVFQVYASSPTTRKYALVPPSS